MKKMHDNSHDADQYSQNGSGQIFSLFWANELGQATHHPFFP